MNDSDGLGGTVGGTTQEPSSTPDKLPGTHDSIESPRMEQTENSVDDTSVKLANSNNQGEQTDGKPKANEN